MFQGNASLRIKLFYSFYKDETKRSDYIEKHALRLNYRPEVSTIDAEFPDDIDPAKSTELQEAYIRNVQQRL